MKKLTLMLLFLIAGNMLIQAQISTGESSAQVIRTGNRAEKGDFGLYLGATTTMFENLAKVDDFKALPLINLKYMFSDKLEGRIGIEWWKSSNKKENEESDYTSKDSESSMLFYPGVAYHFAKSNILDVYVGGELPFGWGSTGYERDDEDFKASRFNIGLGAFIGLQAYICNLPLAVGLEYGVSAMYATASNGTLTKDGMTISNMNEDLKNNRTTIGHQARITFSYFFKL